jgi:hypothetical protein
LGSATFITTQSRLKAGSLEKTNKLLIIIVT